MILQFRQKIQQQAESNKDLAEILKSKGKDWVRNDFVA